VDGEPSHRGEERGVRVLIAGCGYVGIELGRRLAARGDTVYGLRRSAGALPDPIHPISIDLGDPGLAGALPEVDAVVYAVSADASEPGPYRAAYVTGVAALLRALRVRQMPVRRFLFLSSTAVYPDSNGAWVDEESDTDSRSFRGEIMLEGERTALEGPYPAVVLRLGGIYGPGRGRLIDQVRRGEARCPAGEPLWSNRIHRDDAAAAALHLLELDRPAPSYLGVDEEPAPICEVYRFVARLIGAPDPVVNPSPMRERSNKRCSSARLRSTGYQFLFPSFREGYRSILEGVSRSAGEIRGTLQ